MTRRARRTHLTAWLVLTPILLGLLVAAIAGRAARAAAASNTGATEAAP